jgi:hypothetical protein
MMRFSAVFIAVSTCALSDVSTCVMRLPKSSSASATSGHASLQVGISRRGVARGAFGMATSAAWDVDMVSVRQD